jgi:hypothetical protein
MHAPQVSSKPPGDPRLSRRYDDFGQTSDQEVIELLQRAGWGEQAQGQGQGQGQGQAAGDQAATGDQAAGRAAAGHVAQGGPLGHSHPQGQSGEQKAAEAAAAAAPAGPVEEQGAVGGGGGGAPAAAAAAVAAGAHVAVPEGAQGVRPILLLRMTAACRATLHIGGCCSDPPGCGTGAGLAASPPGTCPGQ